MADVADALAREYQYLADGGGVPGPSVQAEVAAGVESTVSSFEDISSSMSGMSAMADGAGFAGVLTDEGDTPEDGTPEETPEETTPGTPASMMPTLAEVMQMSGQAAKLSGHASQYMNLFNQAMGQIQQVASLGQRGQGAAAPAEEAAAEEAAPEEAALAAGVDGAGAAVGADVAERAPIEDIGVAAVGAEQGLEPSPVVRMV
jgi:hypothetical protein